MQCGQNGCLPPGFYSMGPRRLSAENKYRLSRQGKDVCRGDSGEQSCLLGFKGWRAQTVTSAWSSQRAEPAWQSCGERTLRGSGNQHLCLLTLEDPVGGSAKGEQQIKGDGVCALTSRGMCLARAWIP